MESMCLLKISILIVLMYSVLLKFNLGILLVSSTIARWMKNGLDKSSFKGGLELRK